MCIRDSFLAAAGRVSGALVAWRLGEGRQAGEASRRGLSRRLRRAFEKLGPAYIKLGQIVSSGRGHFPEELVDEFKKCRDQVPPMSVKAVRSVVESDFGQPLEAIFPISGPNPWRRRPSPRCMGRG